MRTTRHQRAATAVRSVHTAIFAIELAAIGWLVVSGLQGRRDRSVAIALGLVAAEAAVFVANDGVCPLTPLAQRLGSDRGSVSDIFLPPPSRTDDPDLVERPGGAGHRAPRPGHCHRAGSAASGPRPLNRHTRGSGPRSQLGGRTVPGASGEASR